jgi:protein deglycase
MEKIAIFLANGFETSEALTTADLLRRANIDLDLISINNEFLVSSSKKIKVYADKLIKEVELNSYKMIILPGGDQGVKNLWKEEIVRSIVKNFLKNKNKYIAAICAAPIIIARLLKNNEEKIINLTSHPFYKEEIEENGFKYLKKDFLIQDNIITSISAGTTIKFALEIIKIIKNEEMSNQVYKQIIVN